MADAGGRALALEVDVTGPAYCNPIPMRRHAECEDIASAAVFLASEEAVFVSGLTLNAGGGFMAAGRIFDLKK